MNNLLKFKDILSDYTILHIDSYKVFQKLVKKHLSVVAKEVYTASNSQDGLENFLKYKPDIVIIDLDLEDNRGFELITEIKQINGTQKIILLSDKNDDFELIESLDIKLEGKFEKPFDINHLDLLFENIEPKKIQNNQTITVDEYVLKKLITYAKTKKELLFVNNYKGITLTNQGKILGVKDNIFSVKVPKSLVVALEYEKYCLIQIDQIKQKYIVAKLLKFDKKNNIITLSDPKPVRRGIRDPKKKRLKVDPSFKVTTSIKSHSIPLIPIEVSENYLTVYLKTARVQFSINERLDLTLGFSIDGPSSFIREKKFTKVFGKGEVIRLNRLKDATKIVLQINIDKAGQNVFKKYLQEREFEIIQEFKLKMKI